MGQTPLQLSLGLTESDQQVGDPQTRIMQLLKIKEVAARLSHSEQTVRNLIARGHLECHRCPGIRVSEDQLAAYLISTYRSRETSGPPTKSPRPKPIRHLNADRLRQAWKEQGVD